MANWETKRIWDAVIEIEDEKFVLPVIQRSLVWTEEKMELLFDTLLKGDSFGGIMVIEEERGKQPLFNYRPFTKDGNFISSRQVEQLPQNQLFVIDGQQRLQSFYLGLNGCINGKVLYFDLFSDYNSEYEFKFENDIQKLPKQSKDNQERPIKEHFWYPVKSLLNKLRETVRYKQIVKEIIDESQIFDDIKKDYIEENILSFYENVLNAPTLGISKVLINKTLPEIENRQRIVELFRRLNDGGTRLSSFDLVASILKGFSWEMEGFLREILEKYQDIGLSQENLIKLIFLLQDDYNKEMASIESSDAEFAIRNRERIKVTLKSLKDFLIYSKVYDYYKDSNRSFIPLFFIVYHLFHKNIGNIEIDRFFDNYETGNSDFSLMKRWLFNSLINGVFRSKGAGWIPYKTGIRKILSLIKNYKNKAFPIDELFSIYTDHPITFTLEYTKENIDQLDSSFVYYVMYDLSRTNRMNDIDHIMPKNILESLNYPSEKINSIKNFQLLDYGTNRGHKNGKAFKDWLTAKEYVKDKEAYILLHLIPNDESLWVEEKFEEFEDKRADIILEKIFKYTK
ncbi:MAG: DUF262 domain-containing protein [Dysgonamonadaceae bacterium]|jgi:hypothetical protein|nr:DUF262 domain-containing protein [Dysgonamonadaceae bacterium]